MPEKLRKDGFVNVIYLLIFIFTACFSASKAKGSSYKLQYKKVDSATLDITVYPSLEGQVKAPAIIFFFGGGWKIGSIEQFEPHAQYFAQRGLTCILVDYRVSSRNHTTPFDAVTDARDALQFIMQHAKKMGIDTTRIVVSGGSAGGQLALISTFSPKDIPHFKPKAMVLFNPVLDTGPDGYGYNRLGDAYKTISPVDNIPVDPPPGILFFGTDDHIISENQAKTFCHLVEAKGGSCELKFYKGQGHGFFNYKNKKYFIDTIREADRFLIREGVIEGKPNIKTWLAQHS